MNKYLASLGLVVGIGLLIAGLSLNSDLHFTKANPKYKSGDCVMQIVVSEQGGKNASSTSTAIYIIKGIIENPRTDLPKELQNTKFYSVGLVSIEEDMVNFGWMVPVEELDRLQYTTLVWANEGQINTTGKCNKY